MPIRIHVADRLKFKVGGTITTDTGAREAFEFHLVAKRLSADELRDRTSSDSGSVVDFLAEVAEGWSGVRDDAGAEVPFGPEALRQLMQIPGVAMLAFKSYFEEALARPKT